MFIPTTKKEIEKLGWSKLDVILISGDSYIDSPHIGVAVIGKVLIDAGYKVGIIAQPDIHSEKDVTRLGEPKLFWGVSGGCIDSMVANYTASKKRRKKDDYTPGGENNRRPDRAVIAYSNLIRRFFKNTKPIVLGGIEASLRRIPHYDFWSNKIRRSILFDAKADCLIYGMGETAVLQLAESLSNYQLSIINYQLFENIPGLCYISKTKIENYIELPSFEEVVTDKKVFSEMFFTFYNNNDPKTAKGLVQQNEKRFLVHNPPAPFLKSDELDKVFDLKFERNHAPFYEKIGKVKALETIKTSVLTHRGCYGNCSFCSISVHEGRTVRSRSENSIVNEVKRITKLPKFKGYISDVGGPTANMFGFECSKKKEKGICTKESCIFPEVCPQLKVNHSNQLSLLNKIRNIPGIKKAFVASGIRYDLIFSDHKFGMNYFKEIVKNHVSGQLKIAPEHSEDFVLNLMKKQNKEQLIKFKNLFYKLTDLVEKKQFLTYYFIAAHPGCTQKDMENLKSFTSKHLKTNPKQVQIYLPLPSTFSALMYYTETNPWTGKKIFVEKDLSRKEKQKNVFFKKQARRLRYIKKVS